MTSDNDDTKDAMSSIPYLVMKRILDYVPLNQIDHVASVIDPNGLYILYHHKRVVCEQIKYLKQFPHLAWHLSPTIHESVLEQFPHLFYDWQVLTKRMDLEFIRAHPQLPWYLNEYSYRLNQFSHKDIR